MAVGEAISFHAVRPAGAEDDRGAGEQGVIEIEIGKARVHLRGRVDGSTLAVVLQAIGAST